LKTIDILLQRSISVKNKKRSFLSLMLLSIYCWASLLFGLKAWNEDFSIWNIQELPAVEHVQSTDLGDDFSSTEYRVGTSFQIGQVLLHKGVQGILYDNLICLFVLLPSEHSFTSTQITLYAVWLKKLLFPNHYFW
jgi:hypothetical protein